MKPQPITFAFAAELFTHGSWGARDIAGGAHACTMTFHEGEHAGAAWIEWNIPAIDDSEEIGLTFAVGADGKRVLTEYDGVMALPPVCVLILRDLGITVPAGEGMDEEIAEAETLEGEKIPRRMHALQAERYLLAHECKKADENRAGHDTEGERLQAQADYEAAAAALELFDREHGAELAALALTAKTATLSLVEAARLIIHQRDYFAEQACTYDRTHPSPDDEPDQAFDDWAADLLEKALEQQTATPPATQSQT